jgi:hypothetical protein
VRADGLPAGPDTTQAAAAWHHFAMQVAMLRGEHRVALEHAQEVGRLHDELGFESELDSWAWMVTAICKVMLNEPEGALELADRFSKTESAFASGHEIRALVHIALGDLEAATSAAMAHARLAVSGRITQQSTESLLVLAALAHAENDSSTARRLLLSMGACRPATLTAYSWHLAEQLNLRAEFEAAQTSNRTKPPEDTDDTETLRQEMHRRGWN